MKTSTDIRYSNALIIATVLLVFTMVLHPTGGSIAYIQKISTMLMVTHSVAILSLPFWLLGFWGLFKRLEDNSLFSLAAFIVIVIGLFSALLAAAVNGLVLPLFLNHYLDAPSEKISAIKPIVNYNTTLNHAFDYVYMGASWLSMMLWSIAVLKTHHLPRWLGWFGMVFPLLALVPITLGFTMTDLNGFRFFILEYVVWVVLIIINLRRLSPASIAIGLSQ